MTPTCTQGVLPPADVSRRLVDDLCDFADLPKRDAFTAAEVVELLSGAGYVCDAHTLNDFKRKDYFAPPARGRWSVTHVHQLAAALEARRRWQCGHKLHASKFSAAEISAAKDPDAIVEQARQFSAEDLVLMLTTCEQRQEREVLRVVLMARFALDGIEL